MPVETLSAGPAYSISDTNVRALPPGQIRIMATFQAATSVDIANDFALSNPVNYLPADFKSAGTAGIYCSGGYIRVNGVTPTAIIAVDKA